MILMLEDKNIYTNTLYRPIRDCVAVINKIFPNLKLSNKDYHAVHKALKKCSWLGKREFYDKNGKSHTFYYIGWLKALYAIPNTSSSWDEECESNYADLAINLEKELNRQVLPTITQRKHFSPTEEPKPQEKPWDETNMEYCHKELEDKYQFEGRKIIKITEDQLLKLKNLL